MIYPDVSKVTQKAKPDVQPNEQANAFVGNILDTILNKSKPMAPMAQVPVPAIQPTVSSDLPSLNLPLGAGVPLAPQTPTVTSSKMPDIIADPKVQNIMDFGKSATNLVDAGFKQAPPSAYDQQKSYLDGIISQSGVQEQKAQDIVNGLLLARDMTIKRLGIDNDLQALTNLYNDASARPKMKVTTPEEFFWNKDPKTGEYTSMTKQGSAVLVIALLSQLFGKPVAKQQNINIVNKLGADFADVQNKINQNDYNQAIADFNAKSEGLKANINLKQQKLQQALSPIDAKISYFRDTINQARTIAKDAREQLYKLGTDWIKSTQNATEEQLKRAQQPLLSVYTGDPTKYDFEQRRKAWAVLITYPEYANLPMPTQSSIQEQLGAEKVQGQKLSNEKLTASTNKINADMKLNAQKFEESKKQFAEKMRLGFAKAASGGTKQDNFYNHQMMRAAWNTQTQSWTRNAKTFDEAQTAYLNAVNFAKKIGEDPATYFQVVNAKSALLNSYKNMETSRIWMNQQGKGAYTIPPVSVNPDVANVLNVNQTSQSNRQSLAQQMKNASKGK